MRILLSALLGFQLLAAWMTSQSVIDAVRARNHAALRKLLNARGNPNAADASGTTALMYAAHLNDEESVELLLHSDAKATAANDYGVTALSEAAANGNARNAEALLKAGADPNTSTPEGETVLMTASRAGDPATVQLLISNGAEVDRRESWKGQTALMWAAASNHAEVARILLDQGADANARSAAVTPEIKRPPNGNLVSEQPKGELSPLLFAAREGALQAAAVLVDAHANLNAADPDGITPAVMATINGHYDLAALLLNAGADPNVADRWGRATLYAAIDMNTLEPSTTRPSPKTENRISALDLARLALAKGADPNARLKIATPGRGIPDGPDPLLRAGTTPLIRAAKTGDVTAMKLLIEYHADPMLTTEQHVNALMAAAGQGWRYGDSQIRESDALEAVRFCISLGFDINAVNAAHETALHGAADRGAEQIIELLVSKGARLDIKDEKGHTPLDVAMGGEIRGHPGYPGTASLIRKLSGR